MSYHDIEEITLHEGSQSHQALRTMREKYTAEMQDITRSHVTGKRPSDIQSLTVSLETVSYILCQLQPAQTEATLFKEEVRTGVTQRIRLNYLPTGAFHPRAGVFPQLFDSAWAQLVSA